MTFWETIWEQVRREMPAPAARERSWGGFLGAFAVAALLVAVWFPVKFAQELLKLVDLSEKPDRSMEARALFDEAYSLSLTLPSPSAFAASVLAHVDLPPALRAPFATALAALYADDMMLHVPIAPLDLNDLEGIRWRDRLRTEIVRMRPEDLVKMRRACLAAVEAAAAQVPRLTSSDAAAGPEIECPLAALVHPGRFVESLVKPLNADGFPTFAARYEANRYRISGVPPGQPVKPGKLAEPHHLDDPTPFLDGTPFAAILATPMPIAIPEALRSEHHWIVAGSGAGKTNALQYLIAEDLGRATRGECSLVVLDSQRQLIERLSSLKLFAPGEPLDGKLCLLDAADVEHPIAINLFDMRLDRAETLSPLDRQKLINGALDMYDFIIGSLLQSEMTSRQSTLFRFVTRALFAIPDANIRTFHDILQNGAERYQPFIDTLDETTRAFFATDFKTGFKDTKAQVSGRLWAVLGNETFMRMFSSPRSKVDLFAEINTPGKVVLINAEKSLLKDEGTELFGRFFLALVNQAAAQRASLPPERRLPCIVYVDECHNYVRNDPKIQSILAEARQQNIGMVLAHQFLGQIEPPVLRALSANTSIKMAARLEGAEPQTMARDMNTTPNVIRDQRKGAFATFLRGVTPSAISMYFPLASLSRFDVMSAEEQDIVRRRNRETYANVLTGAPSSESASGGEGARGEPSPRRRDPDAS